MIRTVPTDRAVSARAGWSVAWLFVGLVLVVVILMGSSATTHAETEGLPAAPVAEIIVADTPGTVPAVMSAGEDSSEAGDLGAALCLLGVACALALVVLAWRAPSRTYSIERVAGMMRELIAVAPSRTPVPTLTQLCVSRT